MLVLGHYTVQIFFRHRLTFLQCMHALNCASVALQYIATSLAGKSREYYSKSHREETLRERKGKGIQLCPFLSVGGKEDSD
jgi:hypothetical protein